MTAGMPALCQISEIRYLISEFGRVPPKAGRDRAMLVNEKKAPGRYKVEFDARGLASGVYFYRLEVCAVDGNPNGNFSTTRRLVLVK